MLSWFLENSPGSQVCSLSGEDIEKIKLLADTKYRTWEWNYAYGPEYHFSNRFDFKGVKTLCTLFVKDGIIWESEITGSGELEKICKKLIGCRHMPHDLKKVIEGDDLSLSEYDIYNFF
jgi:lipoate-protein ligase A